MYQYPYISMDSTHGITDPLSSTTTSAHKFSAGFSFETQLAKSATLFQTDLFGHAAPEAFQRILIKHARRTAGLDIDFEDLTTFGGQCKPPHDALLMLPPVLLPPATQALGYGMTGHLFRSPASIAALAFVTAGACETPSTLQPASSTGSAGTTSSLLPNMSSAPSESAKDLDRDARRPYSVEEKETLRASTDQAFYLYGKGISLLRGDARLRALLDADDEENPLATADRVLSLDLDLLKRVGALIQAPFPDDWGQAEDTQIADWRKSMIPKILFNLMTASHYKAVPPPVTAGTRAAGPRLALSLRDAQAMVWRQGTVRELQLRIAVLHDNFPVLLTRMRATPSLRIPEGFASLDHLPMELLTAILDYLLVQDYIRALLLKAASQAVPITGALK